MLRHLAGMFAVLLSLSLAGCGGTDDSVTDSTSVDATLAQPCRCVRVLGAGYGERVELLAPAGCVVPLLLNGDPAPLPYCSFVEPGPHLKP